jgi:hypothetical protein
MFGVSAASCFLLCLTSFHGIEFYSASYSVFVLCYDMQTCTAETVIIVDCGLEMPKIFLLALISAFLAVCTWLSVHPSVHERIKQVLSPFWQTTADMTAILMSYFLLFCRGKGHFLIIWWRIWERRADRQFHGNLARITSQKWLEDTRDAKSRRRPFRYKPLEKEREIRLLEISMGEFRNIKAKMVHVDVDSPGEYSAISYTWGDNTKSHGIFIDEDWMATTANVYDVIFKQAPINSTR